MLRMGLGVGDRVDSAESSQAVGAVGLPAQPPQPSLPSARPPAPCRCPSGCSLHACRRGVGSRRLSPFGFAGAQADWEAFVQLGPGSACCSPEEGGSLERAGLFHEECGGCEKG